MLDTTAAGKELGYLPATTYAESVGATFDWLEREVAPGDWRALLPQLAAYPWNLFDYEAEDRFLPREPRGAPDGVNLVSSWLVGPVALQDRTVERVVAGLAGRSHGVVTRQRLLVAGISVDEIRERLEKGALIAEYPAVYRVGHRAPSVEARYLAAVLACGEGALLSGCAAGHLLGLLRGPPPGPEVTAPTERRVKGIKTRRARRARRGATLWRGVPVTTPAETLVDLAAVLDEAELARACHEAGVRHHTKPKQVEAVLTRRPKAPGTKSLRRVLRGEVNVTLSELEKRFLERLVKAGLPLPRTNRPAGSKRVDCRWPDLELTVELDSYRYHNSRHAWEQDRRREREARARGDDFRRYTWNDVFEAPEAMLAELRPLLDTQRPVL